MSENRNFKGIWIPAEIWLDEDLNWIEKVLLVEIDSLSSRGKPCWATNKHFAKFFGLSERSISRYINNLKEKKMIKIKDGTSTSKLRRITPTKLSTLPSQKCPSNLDKTVYQSNTANNTKNKTNTLVHFPEKTENTQESEHGNLYFGVKAVQEVMNSDYVPTNGLLFVKTINCICQRAEQLGLIVDEVEVFDWLEEADWELGNGLKVNSFFGLDKALRKWSEAGVCVY